MVESLRDRNIFYFHQVLNTLTYTIFNQDQLSTDILGFLGEEGRWWDNYSHALKNSPVRIKEEKMNLYDLGAL